MPFASDIIMLASILMFGRKFELNQVLVDPEL